MPDNFNLIKENLRLTQAYCAIQMINSTLGNEAIFRSINPTYYGKPLFNSIKWKQGNFNITEWTQDPYAAPNERLIWELFDYQLEVKKKKIPKTGKKSINTKGDIFAFQIEYTLIDGAATIESEGILDDYNCPPIDTWFHIYYTPQDAVLLAWIPDPFTDLVSRGIKVNPEECIHWLSTLLPGIDFQIIE